ncbi:MAG: VOC family protein [Alphaproteobacteria bacterium]|nr:VOC family protein [Alphaproteobacteria bacterium]MBV9063675.1 VOC family protein [Alphaproteobacteria bacterium]
MTTPPMEYVEFSVGDIARAKKFYAAIFGWAFTDYGPDYTSFTTGAGMGGGFRSDQPPRPGGPLMVFHVDDLEAASERAKNAGAPIVKDIFAFPGGRRFEFRDPDGYDIAAWKQE